MNTDELRKLARAAIDAYTRINLDDDHFDVGSQADIDAVNAFDAAASPTAIIALMDERDQWRQAAELNMQDYQKIYRERDEAYAAVKRLAGALGDLAYPVLHKNLPQSVYMAAQCALADPVVRRIVEGG